MRAAPSPSTLTREEEGRVRGRSLLTSNLEPITPNLAKPEFAMSEYPEDFQKAVDDLIDNWEGGYNVAPADPGGETNMGISRRSYPDLDIRHLTRDQAVAIYFRDFWQKYGLDTVVKDDQIRAKVFNMGVLIGMKTALTLFAGCRNISEYRLACKRYFDAIVIRHPMCAKYLKGWTRRALA